MLFICLDMKISVNHVETMVGSESRDNNVIRRAKTKDKLVRAELAFPA